MILGGFECEGAFCSLIYFILFYFDMNVLTYATDFIMEFCLPPSSNLIVHDDKKNDEKRINLS